jgi:hypothetical protein
MKKINQLIFNLIKDKIVLKKLNNELNKFHKKINKMKILNIIKTPIMKK